MRNQLIASLGLLVAAACDSGPGTLPDSPVLKVTSPQRSLIQDHAGTVVVTGTVAPGDDKSPVATVTVNHVAATVGADGSFTAAVEIQPGATFIHTEATTAKGGKASDTRSVEAGELRAPGANINNAMTAAISANAFTKIADAGGTLMKSTDFTSMLAPMQPMMTTGGSCLGAKVYIDSMTITDAHLSLVPVDGGLSFAVEIDGLDVNAHADYHVACIGGSDTFHITADAVYVAATLDVTPNGMMGFTTALVSPNVNITNLNLTASGLPGAILNLIDLNGVISWAVEKGAEMFMGPMMNQALGALAGPKTLMVAGQTITFQVVPSNIAFTAAEADVSLDAQILISGAENSKGYVYTDNGMPTMSPGMGLQLGLADDLANEMMSQFAALGMINITQPAQGGTFDATNLQPTSPPMISADPADGHMVVYLPDMTATFTLQGKPVAKAALNVSLDVKIAPVNNGYGVAVQLGQPVVYLDILDDIPNQTELTNEDMQKAMQLCLSGQIASIGSLLGSIPLPQMFGLQMRNVSIGADSGYVMVSATLQ
jgi:hypothetical protein